ncbi:SGNH/GDSL hydrolase family protein [Streptomyces millisiae]|uniref:SGNH/GDSL hydrolase family protein n=1 Tax=Streptomyces millisiae TaxID=3075542 RepID=A0ABU2LWM7_9ACTN|nr:SGNH/GDSL hydrolase family protein [Streptomyces sp. DSM 44918]MDT0322014.1 SGNH/GDSL hydrolase family protein [Streptomyces sp. DSM 44918]
MGVVSGRRVFGLLAGLMAVVLGVLVAVGTGQEASGAGERAGERLEKVMADPHPTRSVTPAAGAEWVGTWSAAPTGPEPGTEAGLPDQSLRNVVHTSVGGGSVRVELSNQYGGRPVRFTNVTVALSAGGGPGAVAGSMRRLTFGEGTSVLVPPGERVLSDPVRLEVAAGSDLLVTVYAPDPSGSVTYHRMAQQISYVAAGDAAGEESGAAFTGVAEVWRYVSSVQVLSPGAEGSVAVLGDSLTDGITSTVGANRRWTDLLAERLRTERDAPRLAVLNQGISGNRLLLDGDLTRQYNGASGLRRLGLDVLRQAGLRTVVLQLGINDITAAPQQTDPAAIVAAMRQVTAEAHEAGLWVVGATLAPFGGHHTYTPERERVRQLVNAEIRAGGVFDAVLDFDAALRDPARPQSLLPLHDSGDGLHPSDAGYVAMARAVSLRDLVPDTAEQAL